MFFSYFTVDQVEEKNSIAPLVAGLRKEVQGLITEVSPTTGLVVKNLLQFWKIFEMMTSDIFSITLPSSTGYWTCMGILQTRSLCPKTC